ncbi:MAG: PhnD/SsuA/transferrin family substrate-binding protein [Chloroflexota bacterium]
MRYIRCPVPDDQIGYVFSNEDINTINWVINEIVIAGATNTIDYADLPEATRDRFIVLAETQSLPRRTVSTAPDMDASLVASITNVLSTMTDSETGQQILDALDTARFDAFPQGTSTFAEEVTIMLNTLQGE